MRNLYSLYAPALVQPDHIVDVAVLLDAWSGREQELLERVEAEYVLAQFTLEAGVLQPLSDLDASELSKQSMKSFNRLPPSLQKGEGLTILIFQLKAPAPL